MKAFQNPSDAIKHTKECLINFGYVVKTERWQGIPSPDDMYELLGHSLRFMIPETEEELIHEVRPNLPWAKDHFDERVGGEPLNPPPSHVKWPFAQKNNQQFGGMEKFSHTYPERIWPKYASDEPNSLMRGIRFDYGDFDDVVDLMHREPYTRQAFLPIWFPEDTGSAHGERVPCTIGYHFIRRGDHMHVVYYIRSCDYIRHFRDDIYLACMKLYWLLDRLKEMDYENWKDVKPGWYTMHITSLHVFNKEKGILKQAKM
jgi:hypothetical protein